MKFGKNIEKNRNKLHKKMEPGKKFTDRDIVEESMFFDNVMISFYKKK